MCIPALLFACTETGQQNQTPRPGPNEIEKIGRFCISRGSSEFFLFRDKRVNRRGRGRRRIQFEKRKGRGATPCHSSPILDSKTDPIIIISASRKLTHLFLGSGGLLSLGLGALLTDTLVTGLGAGLTQTTVGSLLTLGQSGALDLGDGVLLGGVGDGEGSTNAGGDTLTLAVGETGLDSLDLLSGRVELLELTALAGEEDQAGLVVLQAGDVVDQRLLRVVGAAVVDRDTDGGSELLGDASLL